MEDRPESEEPKAPETAAEWEKPTVTEFDVSSTTMSGIVGSGPDGGIYS